MDRYQRKKLRSKRKKRRLFWFLVFPLLLVLGAGGAYAGKLYFDAKGALEGTFQPIDRNGSDQRDKTVEIKKDHFSVLIIGVDDSEKREFGSNSRSDALMLATVNQEDKSVKLTSIPRDSYVYIPEVGYETRINAAHAHGGPKATIETVEELLDVPVDYYVSLNFHAFIEVIDALNGVEIDVPYSFSEQDSNDVQGAIQLEKGVQMLNGEEALAFARTRKMDSDVYRGMRQQEVIKAIVKRAASIQSIGRYDDVLDSIGNNMKTDLSFDEMRYLAEFGIKQPSIDTNSLAGRDSEPGGAYYYYLDETALANLRIELKRHLGLVEDTTGNATEQAASDEN
ncbi:LCP family protein [Mangrovibacillus cuniculi]|uniref:LytR family transcriptional regulator n=1 Tax=Mangrovibacillus cuniculi TaxID=2593652 RepID=A0A7S8HGG3_9BACI|nr:LCP family protein [Mangrovibacillus cuniculi]QPC47526.1 LytR family transcriptional regulator [Mangrovibacillus cuniculi]